MVMLGNIVARKEETKVVQCFLPLQIKSSLVEDDKKLKSK